jgi:hypothetical protein
MPVPRTPLFVLVCLGGLAWPAAGAAGEGPQAADEGILKQAGLGSDGPALVEYFRKQTPTAAERARLTQLIKRLGDPSFRVREKASRDLVKAGRPALPYLRPAADGPDLETSRRARRCVAAVEARWGQAVPAAAARTLAHRRPPGALAALLAYLPQADPDLEDEFFAALADLGLRDGRADPLLVAALRDEQPVRRRAAALVVGRSADARQRERVRPLLSDADAATRLRAAQGLVAAKEREAVPALIGLLKDAPLEVAGVAEELLCRIAGEHAPPVSLIADEVSRRTCHAVWEGWWRRRGVRLDLDKLDLEQRWLGYTLICAWAGYEGGSGRVWETGREGKVRWQINGLKSPVDAQVLPGNRVLIAEQGAGRLTERDFQGKILWEYRVPDAGVVTCQRLPGGRTLIATHNRIFEIDAAGKEVRRYAWPTTPIYAAQKLPNGHVLSVDVSLTLTERDEAGKVYRAFKVDILGIGLVKAEVLPGGRVMIGHRTRLVELNARGEVVWESAAAPATVSTVHLPSGNILACSDQQRRVLELDRRGNVVREQKLAGSPVRVRYR